jgi:hypothetical protein
MEQNVRRVGISMPLFPKCSVFVLKMFRPVNEPMRQTVSEVEIVAVIATAFGHTASGDLFPLAIDMIESSILIALCRAGVIEQGQQEENKNQITAHCLAP